MKKASLTVVGTGIKFISHLTTEVKAYIEQSDVVLYLVNEPAMKEWIADSNPNSRALDDLYTKFPLRLHCYQAITNYILDSVREGQHVCVVLYGHPAVFAQPALDAARQARIEGYHAKILPAISAEDCLFADLLIDPGSCGCQSFEATDFLIYDRFFDISSHLILWQVGTIGVLGRPENIDKVKGLAILQAHLEKFYDFDHEIFIYQAAQYPCFEPIILKATLKELSHLKVTSLSTMYIPPKAKKPINKDVLSELGINLVDLQLISNQ